MGNTTNVITLLDGYYGPRYVNYGGMVARCTLYKQQIDMCHTCGRLGHSVDVWPNPNDKQCREFGCRNPPDDHQCQPVCRLCRKDHLTWGPHMQIQIQDYLSTQATIVGTQNTPRVGGCLQQQHHRRLCRRRGIPTTHTTKARRRRQPNALESTPRAEPHSLPYSV
ncbi:hypothetical protein HPB50_013563 [Hyalomma asiaticum]|uniref:Uncharacterized protein n=1 Tax=Hyalomma asiaticum TaxID=266040 RepID=A0ACB7S9J8_HYAAI|nr:hypothetical protein HPB50_013563 [Hyalomma asiaticum]